MSAPIGPGDYVECVESYPEDTTSLGAVYLVEGIREAGDRCGAGRLGYHKCDGVALYLRDAKPSTRGHKGWCANCFRPLYRPDPLLISRLLEQPLPADLEDA